MFNKYTYSYVSYMVTIIFVTFASNSVCFVICLSFLIIVVANNIHDYSNTNTLNDKKSIDTNKTLSDNEYVKRYCNHLRMKYHVLPGKSWGSMDNIKQNTWILNRCDQYFCQPNKLEGRGIYHCIPLK